MIKHLFLFLLMFATLPGLLAQDIVDDDPRRTLTVQQPRLATIRGIVLLNYEDKGEAEEIYNIYKTNPAAFNEITIKYKSSTKTFKFSNPNGHQNPPTIIRYWERLNDRGIDYTFFKLLGLGKSSVEKEFSGLEKIIGSMPPFVAQIAAENKAPTSIELRLMQTRQFNKSPWAVRDAMVEYFKDNNASICSMTGPTISPKTLTSTMVNGVPKFSVDSYVSRKGGGICVVGATRYDVEISAEPPKSTGNEPMLYDQGLSTGNPSTYKVEECIVRIRITRGANQSTDPRVYQSLFNKIADQAFVQAIEIQPAQIE